MTESKEHTEYTNQIASHIKSKLSGCPVCVVDGLRKTDHDCETVIRLNQKKHLDLELFRRIEIAYLCYRGHVGFRHPWRLPSTAHSVKQNKTVPNGPTRARPDIAVYDAVAFPICFIEVQYKSPNPNVQNLAKAMEVPLFLVEPVGSDMLVLQTHLHNPAKGGFSHYMPDDDGARWADEMNYRINESMAQQSSANAHMYDLEDGTTIIESALGRVEGDPLGFQGGLLNASKAFNVGLCSTRRKSPSPIDEEHGDHV